MAYLQSERLLSHGGIKRASLSVVFAEFVPAMEAAS